MPKVPTTELAGKLLSQLRPNSEAACPFLSPQGLHVRTAAMEQYVLFSPFPVPRAMSKDPAIPHVNRGSQWDW